MPSSASREPARLSPIAGFDRTIPAFIEALEARAAPVCFALAFGRSLAFVSPLLPATVVRPGLGALAGHAGLWAVPVLASGALGLGMLGGWSG